MGRAAGSQGLDPGLPGSHRKTQGSPCDARCGRREEGRTHWERLQTEWLDSGSADQGSDLRLGTRGGCCVVIHSTRKELRESVFIHELTGLKTLKAKEDSRQLLMSGAVRDVCFSLALFSTQTLRLTH